MWRFSSREDPVFPIHRLLRQAEPCIIRTTVVPPLSCFSSNADSSSVSLRKRSQRSRPEHLRRERERRGTMTEKFSLLQSMLPTLSDAHKLASKEKIVEDTVNYIKFLEGEKAILEGIKKKLQNKAPKVVMRPVFSRCGNYPKVRVSGGATFLEIKMPFARDQWPI